RTSAVPSRNLRREILKTRSSCAGSIAAGTSLTPRLWQWRVRRASRRVYLRAPAGGRRADALLGGVGGGGGGPRPRPPAPRGGGRGGGAARERRLAQCDGPDGAPAEEAVDALENDAGKMLDLERGRAGDAQHQGGRLTLLALAPRPLQLHGLGMGGDLRPDDV